MSAEAVKEPPLRRFILSAPVRRGNSRAERPSEDVEEEMLVVLGPPPLSLRAVTGLVEAVPPLRLDWDRNPESVMALPALC
jgi:hypothetical protein